MNKTLIAVGVLVVIVLLGAVGYWFYLQDTSSNNIAQENKAVENSDTMQSESTKTASGEGIEKETPRESTGDASVKIDASVEVKTNTAKTHQITYTSSGFSPSTLTVNNGDTVTFKNTSSSGMWVASASHPSHTVYGGTSLAQHCPDADNNDFDQCKNASTGESWSFTFTKTGSWAYHNHSGANHFGTIIVQ